jgi:hypothetical protein
VRGNPVNITSFSQLREEGPYHPFTHSLTAVGLQPALITLINVHHIQIATYAVERIGGVLVGVASDQCSPWNLTFTVRWLTSVSVATLIAS